MRKFLVLFLIGFLSSVNTTFAEPVSKNTEVVVYRNPSCGCCGKWIKHLKANKFTVKEIILDNVDSIKKRYGVPKELASCHTAVVGDYVIEGHVPAGDIENLLATKPKHVGIAVPGMPVGTPGMEMGGRKDSYKVIAFDDKNRTQVFNSYGDD